jgi:hypothetical protein
MSETNTTAPGLSRRRFFGYAGALAGAGLLAGMAGCREDEYVSPASAGINLGSGDIGLLNYAYVLKQLSASFYARATSPFYAGATATEIAYLNDIRDHEVAHRELLKAALGSNAIPTLTIDLSAIDFSSRTSVLTNARSFEELSVSAYNGAGILFTSATNLTLAGKIVSVEARHAAIIRELLQAVSFADTTVLNPISRIDQARTPSQALALATPYIAEKLNADNLPSA